MELTLIFNQQLSISLYTQGAKITLLITVVLLLSAYPFNQNFDYWEELILLTIFIVISGMLMISSYDYLILWLSSEFQNFCLIIMILLYRNSAKAIDASMTFFVAGAFMSAFNLLGINLIYVSLGTINFAEQYLIMTMPFILEEFPAVALGTLLVLFYLFFKLAVFPFHIWSVMVADSLSYFILYQFSTVSKISAIIPVIQIIALFLYQYSFWFWICIMIAITSIIMGAFGAFNESNIKKFIVYSGINHFGWILLPLAVDDHMAIPIALFYFFIYLVLSVSFFAILFAVIPTSGADSITMIKDFAYLIHLKYIVLLSFIVTLFSFMGIPPFAGFFSKALIFMFFFENGFMVIPILLIPMTALSAFYYINIIILLFVGETSNIPLLMPITKKLLGFITLFILFNITCIFFLSFLFTALFII